MRAFALLHALVSIALPPRCPGCGEVVEADHRFCSRCWRGLRFLGDPACAGCGLPFDHHRGEGARCGACLADPPRHAGIRAAVAYGPVAREVALRLKYGGRLALAETIARLMLRHVPPDALLVPVPLHPRRIWSRGYNQAALIADAIRRRTGLAVAAEALVRTRATPPLRGLGRRQRSAAVRGAFRISGDAAVHGRAIVLVDDVHTSGATADACTAVLLRAGAASVSILCWARVLDAEDAAAPD